MDSLSKSRLFVGLYFFIIVGSVLVSIWSVYADPIINNDGILYIRSAQALSQGDINSAILLHKWPFYSSLIAAINTVTNFDYETCAHILNLIFNVLTGIFFILIIKQLGGTRTTLIIAALVIVSFPGLNEIRSYIVRDHGYIAFYLCALLYLFKAYNFRSKKYLSLSVLFMLVALLFRIEASVFLLAIPCAYFLSGPDRITLSRPLTYTLIGLISIGLISIFGWWLYSPNQNSNVSLFSLENIQTGWQQTYKYLDTKIDILKKQVLNTSSTSTGRLVFIWTTMGIITTQVILILSIPYSVLTGYAIKRHLCFPNPGNIKPWKLFIYFNLGVLSIFTLTKLFLTDRYPLALTVTLLLAVPFALEQIYSRWKTQSFISLKSNLGYLLLCFILLINSIDGLTSYSKKHYLKHAGEWIENNVREDSKVLFNNRILDFYSNLDDESSTVVDNKMLIHDFYRGKWIKFDYLALVIKPDPKFEAHLTKTLWVLPVKTFKNQRNHQVRIYDIKAHRNRKDQ